MATDTLPKVKGETREKVALKPGFHLADWTRLMKTPSVDFSGRGGGLPRKVTLEELRQHNKNYDCWTSYNGKVYNISNYVHYHPGGENMLMKGAGKDCTALFNKYHRWVNIESMLSKCYIGPLSVEKAEPLAEEDHLPVSTSHSPSKSTDESKTLSSTDIGELTTKLEAQNLLNETDKDH